MNCFVKLFHNDTNAAVDYIWPAGHGLPAAAAAATAVAVAIASATYIYKYISICMAQLFFFLAAIINVFYLPKVCREMLQKNFFTCAKKYATIFFTIGNK